MLKLVEMFAAAILVVTMLAIVAIAMGFLLQQHGVGQGAEMAERHPPDLPAHSLQGTRVPSRLG